MHTIVLCHQRPRSTSRKEFQRDWYTRRHHRVLDLQSALGFHRYRQSHQVSCWNPLYQITRATRSWAVTAPFSAQTGHPVRPPWKSDRPALPQPGWDVVETLTYPDAREMRETLTSTSGRKALGRLATDHTTHARHTLSLVASSHMAVRDPTPSFPQICFLFFLRPWPDETNQTLLDYWGTQHKDLFVSFQEILGYREYEQLHVEDEPEARRLIEPLDPPEAAPFAGIARVTYPNLRTLGLRSLAPSTLAANVKLVRDETTFADMQRSRLVLGRELQHASSPPK